MKYDNQEEEGLFDSKYTPLTKAQALKLFGEKGLSPQVSSPWSIVKFQSVLTIAFTMLSVVLCFVLFLSQNISLSVLFGGLLGIIPTIAFILRMSLSNKAPEKSAKTYVSGLVKAEVIKLTLSFTILICVIRFFHGLNWLSFLGMYLITLQAYWLVGLVNKK
jgi:F0F1-type ATP synthase assembly protein I